MSNTYYVYDPRMGAPMIPDFVPKWAHSVLGWVSTVFSGSVVIQAAMTPQTFQAWGAAVIAVLVLAFNGFLLCYNRWMKRNEQAKITARLSDDDITVRPAKPK